jgi:Tfp pilus assembly protein PilO
MSGMSADATERLWNRGLHALGAVATAAAASALAALLYFPLRAHESDLDSKLNGAWNLLQSADALAEQHAAAKQSLAKAEDRIRTIREQIPELAEEAKFLAQLSQLAEDSGFEVLDYRPGSSEAHDFCRQIRVHVRGRGEYESLCRFLAGLDRLPRLCRTAGFAIDSTRANADGYDVEMSLTIFYGVREDALDAAKGKSNG